MSVLFLDTSSEYLEYSGAPSVTRPFSFSFWYYSDAFISNSILFSLGDATNDYYHRVLATNLGSVFLQDKGSITIATAQHVTPFMATDTWVHIAGVFASSTSRSIYVDGDKITNTTDAGTGPTIEYITVAAHHAGAGVGNYAKGRIAELTLYDVALTDDEVDTLVERHWPLLIQRIETKHYWELPGNGGPSRDQVGAVDLAWYNTPVVADHVPLIYPAETVTTPSGPGTPPSGGGSISRFPANLLGI